MELFARWKYQGRLITETTLNTDDVGEGYAGFSLINENHPGRQGIIPSRLSMKMKCWAVRASASSRNR